MPTQLDPPGDFNNPWNVTEPGYFLRANWRLPITVTTGWSTSIVPNQNDGEARRGLIGKPTRSCSASLLAADQDEASKALSIQQNAGFSRQLFPLYSDQVKTNQSYSETFTLHIHSDYDLSMYRFEEDQYLIVFNPNTREFAFRNIHEINYGLNRITFLQALTMDIDEDTLIFPTIQSRIQLKTSTNAISDRVLSFTSRGDELPGDWTVEPSQAPNTTPAGFSEYNGQPIFPFTPNFRSSTKIEYVRTGKFSPVGNTQIASVYGERMRQARNFKMLFDNRAEFWDLLKLFDSRAGRTYSWWLPSFTDEYAVTEFTATGIKVKAFGPEEDWNMRPYVSLTLLDGSVEIREIDSISTTPNEDELIFTDGAFTETDLSNVLRCGFAQHVRFSKDSMVERWVTETVVEAQVQTVEVIEEKTILLADLPESTTTAVSTKYTPQSCDTDPPCDPICFECANCFMSTNTKLALDIVEVVANATNNGLDASFGNYLTQNTPFEVPFSEVDNGYIVFRTTLEQSSGRTMDVMIRYDCTLGLWQWEYTIDLGTPKTFRACGNCLAGGASAGVDGCSNFNLGSESIFIDDCWNTTRIDSGTIGNGWRIDDNGRGCNGIAGWKDHTSGTFSNTGLSATKSAIQWGIRGEWSVDSDLQCCQDYQNQDAPCIPCGGGGILGLLNCGDTLTVAADCPPILLGTSGGSCNGCPIIIFNVGPSCSCCTSDETDCDCLLITMDPGCLYECGSEDCPREVL